MQHFDMMRMFEFNVLAVSA